MSTPTGRPLSQQPHSHVEAGDLVPVLRPSAPVGQRNPLVPAAELASQGVQVDSAHITDATAAGRAMLTAEDAQAQLALVDVLEIPANTVHPDFSRAYGSGGVLAWLLDKVTVLTQQLAAVSGSPAAAAPTDGQVDDQGDTFSFLPVPAYPSFAQYKVNGLPGVTGAVALDATNSYVQGARIYLKVVGPVSRNGLAVYVAGSGNMPDGAVLTNADPFTGTAVPPSQGAITPGQTTATPTITVFQTTTY